LGIVVNSGQCLLNSVLFDLEKHQGSTRALDELEFPSTCDSSRNVAYGGYDPRDSFRHTLSDTTDATCQKCDD
jgi:hypothetical protein